MTDTKIYEALAKMQGQLEATARTAQGQARGGRYKYSTIADVWEAIRKPLSDNGLAITQTEGLHEGWITLTTTLRHSSGESLEGCRPIATVEGAIRDPQAYGSALTYARRYGITALVGIAPADDDDGKAAKAAGHQSAGKTQPAGLRGGQDKTPPADDQIKLYGYPEDGTTVTKRYSRSIAAVAAYIDDLEVAVQHNASAWDTNQDGIAIAHKGAQVNGRQDLLDRLDNIQGQAEGLAQLEGHPMAAG